MKKFILTTIFSCLLFFLLLTPVFCTRKPITIALFTKRGEADPYWSRAVGFMKEATDDLGMKLVVYYAYGDHIKMLENVKASVAPGPNKADFLVLVNFKKQMNTMLQIAEQAKTPAIVFNQGFTEEDNAGKPRQRYKYWLGSVLPNDVDAGALLAEELIKHAKPGSDKKIHMIAISGFASEYSTIERIKGLRQVVAANKNVVLEQITPGDWTAQRARKIFLGLKQRYPKATVVWVANDNMAMGVIQGAKELGLKPGKDITIGSIDWTAQAINSVKRGELDTTVGGPFMNGAWCAVIAYDYMHGKDFASDFTEINTKMYAINKRNYSLYSKVINISDWHTTNFRKFSKILNPHVKKYSFGVNAYINAK